MGVDLGREGESQEAVELRTQLRRLKEQIMTTSQAHEEETDRVSQASCFLNYKFARFETAAFPL